MNNRPEREVREGKGSLDRLPAMPDIFWLGRNFVTPNPRCKKCGEVMMKNFAGFFICQYCRIRNEGVNK